MDRRGHFTAVLLFLIMWCRFSPSVIANESDTSVATMLRVLADSSNFGRQYVAQLLGEMKSTEAVPALIMALRDEDFDVRHQVAAALGEIGAKEAVPALLEAAKYEYFYYDANVAAVKAIGEIGIAAAPAIVQSWAEDADWWERPEAYQAMGRIGLAALPLCIALLQDNNPAIRSNAAGALGEIGLSAKEALSALIQALSDHHASVRARAAGAIGQIGDPAGVPALIIALQDTDASVRNEAAWALGQFGSGALEAVPTLIKALYDTDRYVPGKAARVLGQMGLLAKDAIPALIESRTSEAIEALGKIGTDAVPALIAALPSSRAVSALGKIGDKAAIPALLEVVKDGTDYFGTREAVNVLVEMGVDVVPALMHALHSADPKAQSNAAELLNKAITKSPLAPEMAPMLIEYLRNSSGNTRTYIARTLGKIGAPANSAVPLLIDMLSDTNSQVRQGAAIALGDIGTVEAVPALIKAYSDTSPSVRQEVVVALEIIGSEAAIPVFIDALDDPEAIIRGIAVRALGKMNLGPPKLVPLLVERLSDNGYWVGRETVKILSALSTAEAISALRDALYNEPEVRGLAANALEVLSPDIYQQAFYDPRKVVRIVFNDSSLSGKITTRAFINNNGVWQYNGTSLETKVASDLAETLKRFYIYHYDGSAEVDGCYYPAADTWQIELTLVDGSTVTFDRGPLEWGGGWFPVPFYHIKVSNQTSNQIGNLVVHKKVVGDMLQRLYDVFQSVGW